MGRCTDFCTWCGKRGEKDGGIWLSINYPIRGELIEELGYLGKDFVNGFFANLFNMTEYFLIHTDFQYL